MALHPHFVRSMTLKALLEDPNLKNPPAALDHSSSLVKVKKESDSKELPQFNYGSAFLGPNLWDKTYDGLDFNLEYMDLDEFLTENGIGGTDTTAPKTSPQQNLEGTNPIVMQMPSPRQFLKSPPLSPSQFSTTSIQGPAEPGQLSPFPSSDTGKKSPSHPVSPFNVEFQMNEKDLALASIPGQEDFDPRKRNFSEEELKPQPILKKSKKVFVPEDMKDDRYWARRHKNNFAAKRSRDARRVKENQIAMRAAFLEKENTVLREELNKMRKENVKLQSKVNQYEMSNDLDSVTSSSILGIP